MIVVKIELHSAITGKVTELAKAIICNVGGTRTKGNYEARAYRKGAPMPRTSEELNSKAIRSGRVEGHQRLAKSVWVLVRKALEAMDY